VRGSRNSLIAWALLATFAIVLVLVGYFVLPGLLVHGTLNKADHLAALNDVRTSAVEAVGAISVAVGVFLTALTYYSTREDEARERLAEAAAQLGAAPRTTARLAAIIILESIARSEPALHMDVVRTLTAYLREEAAWKAGRAPAHRAEVQSIVDVLGRRKPGREPADYRLDLSGVDLRNVFLNAARLERAKLFQAHLEDVVAVEGAHLDHAILREAVLDRAILTGVHFNGADLSGASARDATLRATHLGDATLTGTKLHGADLLGAHDADLKAAELDAGTTCPDGRLGPDCGSPPGA
jgi:uncharacterized protein YjbI with pentapeptide repeats